MEQVIKTSYFDKGSFIETDSWFGDVYLVFKKPYFKKQNNFGNAKWRYHREVSDKNIADLIKGKQRDVTLEFNEGLKITKQGKQEIIENNDFVINYHYWGLIFYLLNKKVINKITKINNIIYLKSFDDETIGILRMIERY
jgi:hypothetical protein